MHILRYHISFTQLHILLSFIQSHFVIVSGAVILFEIAFHTVSIGYVIRAFMALSSQNYLPACGKFIHCRNRGDAVVLDGGCSGAEGVRGSGNRDAVDRCCDCGSSCGGKAAMGPQQRRRNQDRTQSRGDDVGRTAVGAAMTMLGLIK
jgi:hypothetical protein